MVNGPLFIGINGSVLALDRTTGQEVWKTRLKNSDFVNVVLEDGALYATTRGEIFCLDPSTGQVRWKNPLKGQGLGVASIATSNGSQAALLRAKRMQDAANDAAGASAITPGV